MSPLNAAAPANAAREEKEEKGEREKMMKYGELAEKKEEKKKKYGRVNVRVESSVLYSAPNPALIRRRVEADMIDTMSIMRIQNIQKKCKKRGGQFIARLFWLVLELVLWSGTSTGRLFDMD